MSTTTAPAPFVFDRDYRNVEQVRPFYAEFLLRLAELKAAGQYPYNDSFKGCIPSLSTTDDKNEDTAIYLLQTMRSQDSMRANMVAFIAAGGITPDALESGQVWRGTVAEWGFYVGGTGWMATANARLTRDSHGRLVVIEHRKRNGRLANENVLIQKESAA